MDPRPTASAIVRGALAESGIELVSSCGIAAYDARAPEAFRSAVLFPEAQGLVVAASAGPTLWRRFRQRMDARARRREDPWADVHPYDAFVGETLDRADEALACAGIRSRRFEAAALAPVRVSFIALAEMVGLGGRGPMALLIHPEHGAWWALRGAWLVDGEVDPSGPLARSPCDGCAAPCVGSRQGPSAAPGLASATPAARGRCVVGQASRYDDDQIAYHHDRARALAAFRQMTVAP